MIDGLKNDHPEVFNLPITSIADIKTLNLVNTPKMFSDFNGNEITVPVQPLFYI